MSEEDNKLTGVCVWFDPAKGMGFIAKDDGSGDLFVHWSNISMEGYKTLKPGQVVSYVLGENHRGPQAEEVVILREPDPENNEV